jgi:hypothetical protein
MRCVPQFAGLSAKRCNVALLSWVPRFTRQRIRSSPSITPASREPGVGVDLVCAQHKSGQGSGGGATSGANEKSAVLRSEATQRGSSLDELKNNRNTAIPESFQRLGRGRYCGIWTVEGSSPDGRNRIFHRVNCKTWGCCFCGPRKAKKYKYLIGQIAEREQLTRFLTLTLDPSKIEGDSVEYLCSVFNKFRLYLRREYGNSHHVTAAIARWQIRASAGVLAKPQQHKLRPSGTNRTIWILLPTDETHSIRHHASFTLYTRF